MTAKQNASQIPGKASKVRDESDIASGRLLILDESIKRLCLVGKELHAAGWAVATASLNLDAVSAQIDTWQPDIILMIVDALTPHILEHITRLGHPGIRPLILFSQDARPASIHAATQAGVMAYVVDEFHVARFRSIAEAARARLHRFTTLREELQQTREQLQKRKQIDRAKGILMQQRGCSESEAYQLLRNLAMNQRKSLNDVAADLIAVAHLIRK